MSVCHRRRLPIRPPSLITFGAIADTSVPGRRSAHDGSSNGCSVSWGVESGLAARGVWSLTVGIRLACLVAGCLLGTVGVSAQPGPRVQETASDLGILAGRPTIRPTRIDVRPDIDGRLDDAVWRDAATITRFVQQQPLDGAPATEQTEVYLAYDSQRLYLGFRVHYTDPTILRANRADRDQVFFDDLVTVYLDTFLDQQRAYVFGVNAYGVQDDGIVNAAFASQGGIPFPDRSWDALFDTSARIVDDGYTAEMAIPFKSLRYPQRDGDEVHRWGLQIVREIQGKDRENDVWAPMSRDEQSFLAQMGVLDGMTGLSTSRNLEILPTFTAIKFGSLPEDSAAFVDQATDAAAGVNLKYGITSNLTADFTYNPDFSQIESNRPQIDVNQRFPLFFSELRPFFLEGQEIFNLVSPVNLVHTRTIVDPRYGGKLTGKVGNTTLGLIVAEDEAAGRRVDSSDPGFGRSAQFLIARARYDLYTGSHIGAIVTDRQFLGSYNRVAGLDGQFRLSRSDTLNITAVQSDTRQEDGERRSGPMWGALYNHNARHFNTSGFIGVTDPGFRTDTGFVQRVDTKLVGATASYIWWPEHWVINWGPRINVSRNYTFDDVLEDESVTGGLRVGFARNISVTANVTRALERFGGIDFRKWNQGTSLTVNTSRRVAFGGRLFGGDQVFFDVDNPFLGRGMSGGLNVTLRPGARVAVGAELRHQPVRRHTAGRSRGLRRQDRARVHDLPVH
jgi:hypothetical protein